MTCAECKWLDKSRRIYWEGCYNWFYVCRRQELNQKAANKVMNRGGTIFAPSQLKVTGENLGTPVCVNMKLDDVTEVLNQEEFNFNENV